MHKSQDVFSAAVHRIIYDGATVSGSDEALRRFLDRCAVPLWSQCTAECKWHEWYCGGVIIRAQSSVSERRTRVLLRADDRYASRSPELELILAARDRYAALRRVHDEDPLPYWQMRQFR